MTRKELLKSKEYWITQVQLNLFNLIENYRKKNNLNKTQLAKELGVTKGYVTQVLNGDFDHKVSKLIDLSLAFNKVPIISYLDIDQYIKNDAENKPNFLDNIHKRPIEFNTFIYSTTGNENIANGNFYKNKEEILESKPNYTKAVGASDFSYTTMG